MEWVVYGIKLFNQLYGEIFFVNPTGELAPLQKLLLLGQFYQESRIGVTVE